MLTPRQKGTTIVRFSHEATNARKSGLFVRQYDMNAESPQGDFVHLLPRFLTARPRATCAGVY